MSEAASSKSRARGARQTSTTRPHETAHAEAGTAAANYRAATQDRLGQALSDLLENPLVTGAIGRAWGAREKAAQAQELWMGALNLPSAADIERLTRRLRSVSQRLEGVEDGVQRLSRTLVQGSSIDARLHTIEERLQAISQELQELREAVLAASSAASAQGGAHVAAGAAPARSRSQPATRAKARAKR